MSFKPDITGKENNQNIANRTAQNFPKKNNFEQNQPPTIVTSFGPINVNSNSNS